MRIRKSHIFLFASIFVILAIIGAWLFYDSYFPQKTTITCDTFKKTYIESDCGYLSSSKDNKTHRVIGKIVQQTERDNKYYIDVFIKNSATSGFTETLQLPPDEIGVGLVSLLPYPTGEQTDVSEYHSQEAKNYKTSEALHMLTKDKDIIISVATPTDSEIDQIQDYIGKNDLTSCFSYNKKLISYLKNPTPLNQLVFSITKLLSSCSVPTITITHVE